MTVAERKRREIALAQNKKLKAEIFSLWSYELYRLSIANRVNPTEERSEDDCVYLFFLVVS